MKELIRRTSSLFLVASSFVLVLLALSLLDTPLLAQDDAPVESSSPTLDLGTVELESSAPPEAEETFQRGVAALHSFFYDEAADLFRRTQEIAPDFAMAYWGEAMTYNHPLWRQQDRDAAREVLKRLAPTPEERAAKAPTARERAYLEAVEILYGEGSKAERDLAYSEKMKEIAARWGRDVNAAAFYALSLQGLMRDGVQGLKDRMRSAAVLERLFDLHRSHPGVLHYLIHAYDDPVHAPLGLRAAVLYADVAPSVPHALHMPSHIFVQLGIWDRVVASNIDAYQASVDWVKARGHSRAKEDFHSLAWLHYGYLQQSRFGKADETYAIIDEVAEETGQPWVIQYRDSMRARRILESRQWRPDLEVTVPEGATMSEKSSLAALLLAQGWSALEAEPADPETARQALAGLETLADEMERPAITILAEELQALIALGEDRTEDALALLREAVAREERMDPPSGPPHPVQSAHELYGEVLLELGRPQQALEQFEASLQRTPNRALSLLGAARSARAAGEGEKAASHYRSLAGIWSTADPELPRVSEVRDYLAAWDARGSVIEVGGSG